jgi:hypothetical protein
MSKKSPSEGTRWQFWAPILNAETRRTQRKALNWMDQEQEQDYEQEILIDALAVLDRVAICLVDPEIRFLSRVALSGFGGARKECTALSPFVWRR